jgi:hypothetical protein
VAVADILVTVLPLGGKKGDVISISGSFMTTYKEDAGNGIR